MITLKIKKEMSVFVKHFSKKVPHRWYRHGRKVFRLTPESMFDKESRTFHYECIENNYKSGCYIIGFNLYDDMIPITEDEWRNAMENCINPY